MRILIASGFVIGMGFSQSAFSGAGDDVSASNGRCDAVARKAEKIMLGRQAGLPPADIEAEDEKVDPSERGKALRNNLMITSVFYPVEKSQDAKAAVARRYADHYKEDCLDRKRWSEE